MPKTSCISSLNHVKSSATGLNDSRYTPGIAGVLNKKRKCPTWPGATLASVNSAGRLQAIQVASQRELILEVGSLVASLITTGPLLYHVAVPVFVASTVAKYVWFRCNCPGSTRVVPVWSYSAYPPMPHLKLPGDTTQMLNVSAAG